MKEALSPASAVALGYAPARSKVRFEHLLLFDEEIGTVVSRASDPLVAQLRLAWWRDSLSKSAEDRAKGAPLLDQVEGFWGASAPLLGDLVDAWELLLGELPIAPSVIEELAEARSRCLLSFLDDDQRGENSERVKAAVLFWTSANICETALKERFEPGVIDQFVSKQEPIRGRLPRVLRPLAVLEVLSRRALARGGGPLLATRGDALAALRVGAIGL